MGVLSEIENIKDFIKSCLRDPDFVGFNVCASKHPGRSYILGKCRDSFKARYTLAVQLDSVDPYERTIIYDTIHIALYGTKMDTKLLEEEMVLKMEKH